MAPARQLIYQIGADKSRTARYQYLLSIHAKAPQKYNHEMFIELIRSSVGLSEVN